jgi:simple sugar transport system ATP-binding protein
MALIVASSELEELITYSSRIVVLRDRRQVKELRGDEISIGAIVRSIAEEGGAQQ